MSVEVMARVWRAELEERAKFVLLAIADRTNDEGGGFWEVVSTIMGKCSMPERSVQRRIQQLIATRLLAWVADPCVGPDGRRRGTEYKIDLDVLDSLPRAKHVPVRSVSGGVPRGATVTGATVAPVPPAPDRGAKSVPGWVPNRGAAVAPNPTTTTNPTTDPKQPSNARGRAIPAALPDLPVGVSPELWLGWVEVRKKIPRAPFTAQAQAVALNVLRRRSAAGEDVARLLEQATVGAWRGLDWPIKGGTARKGRAEPPATPAPEPEETFGHCPCGQPYPNTFFRGRRQCPACAEAGIVHPEPAALADARGKL